MDTDICTHQADMLTSTQTQSSLIFQCQPRSPEVSLYSYIFFPKAFLPLVFSLALLFIKSCFEKSTYLLNITKFSCWWPQAFKSTFSPTFSRKQMYVLIKKCSQSLLQYIYCLKSSEESTFLLSHEKILGKKAYKQQQRWTWESERVMIQV